MKPEAVDIKVISHGRDDSSNLMNKFVQIIVYQGV